MAGYALHHWRGSRLAARGRRTGSVGSRGAAQEPDILVHPQVSADRDDDGSWQEGSSRQRGGQGSRGFTIIELIVALAVLAILVALAVPNFNDATLTARLNGFANSLVASSQVARSEAIKRNTNITLCMSANGTTCAGSWGMAAGLDNPRRRDPDPPPAGPSDRVRASPAARPAVWSFAARLSA